MRIGLFGGSFNPPHEGHVRAARIFAEEAKLDQLIVMPAGIPPHKTLSPGADDLDRLNMTEIAFSEIDKAEVSSFEIEEGGASYTIDTLEAIRFSNPKDELFLYMGDDMLLIFREWKEYRKILDMCTLFVMRRNEIVPGLTEAVASLSNECAGAGMGMGRTEKKIILSQTAPEPISSTEIREVLRRGGCPAEIDERVYDYILRNKLYQ